VRKLLRHELVRVVLTTLSAFLFAWGMFHLTGRYFEAGPALLASGFGSFLFWRGARLFRDKRGRRR